MKVLRLHDCKTRRQRFKVFINKVFSSLRRVSSVPLAEGLQLSIFLKECT